MPHTLSIILCLLLALVAAAQSPDAGSKMLKLSRHRVVAAKFVQIRRIAELDMEVRATGSMVSELDGRLRWQVDAPAKSVTVIDREKLTHFDGGSGKTSVLAHDNFPWLKMLRNALDDWLSGDPARIAERFDVTAPRPDTLHLVPRDAALKNLCRSVDITIAPGGDAIRSIRIAESGGDTLEIRFSEVVNNPQLPPDTWRMPPR